MIRQCAWCKLIFGEKEPLEDRSITHGICLNCSDELIQEQNQINLKIEVVFSEKV